MVVMLSRLLGATGYGRFVAVLAIASFLTPFAGMGLSHVLLRDGAKNPQLIDRMRGHGLKVWLSTALLSGGVAIAAAWWWLPQDLPWLAVPVAMLAEIAVASLIELLARAEQARHRISRFGAINAGLHIARLAALTPYALWGTATLGGWLWLYAASSVVYAAGLYGALRINTARRKAVPIPLVEGMPFTMASLSVRLQAEFNKPVLAQHGFALAGNFGAAQRVTDLASLPLLALQDALWPRLYASTNSNRDLRGVGFLMLTLALVAGGALWFAAPRLAFLLGPEFGPAGDILRWLALLPAMQCLRNLFSFQSIAAKRTDLIGWSSAAGATTGVIVLLLLASKLGVAAATLAAYASEVTIIAVHFFGSWKTACRYE